MKASDPPIYVTRSFLPPLEDFVPLLEEIWQSRVLTNGGGFHQALETALGEYLGVPYISLVCNGTVALQLALLAARIGGGEVITTPFSFPATSHTIALAGATPVFADIGESVFNLDPAAAEAAITERTSAILPVHCYGRPCDVAAFERLSAKYDIPVIYDAAHAFGVNGSDGASVLGHGRFATLSFHATKVFNTFEGGAVVMQNAADKLLIDRLKNFGIASETEVELAGINGKMSEINAAMGLLQLGHIDQVIAGRARIDARYRESLDGVCGITLPDASKAARQNHSYFPILIDAKAYGESRDALYERLKAQGIHSRRYFYPLLANLPMYRGLPSASTALLPQANAIADSVLCLPIFPEMTEADLVRVIDAIVN